MYLVKFIILRCLVCFINITKPVISTSINLSENSSKPNIAFCARGVWFRKGFPVPVIEHREELIIGPIALLLLHYIMALRYLRNKNNKLICVYIWELFACIYVYIH